MSNFDLGIETECVLCESEQKMFWSFFDQNFFLRAPAPDPGWIGSCSAASAAPVALAARAARSVMQ